MRSRNHARAKQLDSALSSFHQRTPLPGILAAARRDAFIEQVLESIRRVDYVGIVRARGLSPKRADPTSAIFDPILGAAVLQDGGKFDEACWLVFLSVHFGRNRRSGWALARNTLGALGASQRWDWATTSASPRQFRAWLAKNKAVLQATGGFGNHRKYQSLDALSRTGTGAAVETYVSWIDPKRGHAACFADALNRCRADPREAFDHLYTSMAAVASFGRTARFDYLTMIGKLRLANIEPGSTYMAGATGPLAGARLLFSGSTNASTTRRVLDAHLVELGAHLDLGMQVLEDALCNWQKSPNRFIPFRG